MKFKAAVTGLLVAMPIAGNYYNLYISSIFSPNIDKLGIKAYIWARYGSFI